MASVKTYLKATKVLFEQEVERLKEQAKAQAKAQYEAGKQEYDEARQEVINTIDKLQSIIDTIKAPRKIAQDLLVATMVKYEETKSSVLLAKAELDETAEKLAALD